MSLRNKALFLAVILGVLLPQSFAQSQKFFHDPLLGLSYSYPGRFAPEPPVPPAKSEPSSPPCVQPSLTASTTTTAGSTAFLFSTIDKTCPAVLQAAQEHLGSFTKEQVLRQLKRYGTPSITDDPSRYTIAGHPAAITLAWAQAPDTPSGKPGAVTYAAKACVLGSVPAKSKKEPPVDIKHVICFDFTTPQRDLLTLLLGFTIQFDNDPPQALVPGSILR